MSDVQIIPAVLEKDVGELKNKLRAIGDVSDWVHVDFLDGSKFASTKTASLVEVGSTFKNFKIEVHLMVADPQKHFLEVAQIGAKRCIIHQDSYEDIEETEKAIKKLISLNIKPIITCSPEVELSTNWKSRVDYQVMGVKPGRMGQTQLTDTVKKVLSLKKTVAGRGSIIAVDGGVNSTNSNQLLNAGADRLVVGSGFWSVRDKKDYLQQLKE